MPFKFDADYLDTPTDIMGGFDCIAYIALADWILVWPEFDPDPQTDPSLVTLMGDFVLTPGANFIKIKCSNKKSGLSSKSQGERDSRSLNNSGSIFRAGADDDNAALSRKLNDVYGVIILTDGINGEVRTVVGDSIRQCWFTADLDYGKMPEDPKGLTISFEADSFVPGYKYNGIIPTRDLPQHTFSISVNPPIGTIPSVGGYVDVDVTATRDGLPTLVAYRITSSWLTVTPRASGVYRISAGTNPKESDRPGAVEFYPVGSLLSESVAIAQPASEFDIVVDPVNVDFPPAGGVIDITVKATCNGLPVAYDKKSAPSWITAMPGTPATLTAKENNDPARGDSVIWQIPGTSATATNHIAQAGIDIPDTYIGVVNTAYPTAADIKALPVIKSNNTNVTHSFTTVNQWAIIAEPASFDPFVQVVDGYGFDKTRSFRVDTVTIDAVEYRVLIYAPPLATTDINYKLSFKK